MSNILKGLQLNELSPATLASYKKKAGAEASAADKVGDTKKADKRFSGIVKATKKEFDNDSKDVKEAYNNYHANRTGFSRGQRDDERHDLDKPTQVWGLKINGKVWSKGGVDVTFNSKEAALNIRNSILKNRPDLEIGLVTKGGVAEELDENLHKWFKEKWVRFGPDGKIRGDCARGDDSEGKPKCLPQSKAQNLGKKGRASAAARKRREDPNPERSGKAINVNTKKKSNESVVIGRDEGNFAGDTPVNLGGVVVKNLTIGDIVSYLGQKAKILAMSKTGNTSRIHIPSGMGGVTKDVLTKDLKRTSLSEEELDEACWKGYHKEGNKKMFGKTYPNCVKNTNEEQEVEEAQQCPECGGPMFSDLLLAEKKDACYHKVRSRYKVWPSAYASGALVQCRKKGASNWGNGGKKNEGVAEGFSNDMSTEDMIVYLKQHHDKNLHPDYLNHLISTNSKFVLKNIPINSIRTELSGLDRAKVEQYKQMDFSKAPPIVVGSDGNILDGYHRATVAKALGIPTIKAYVGVKGQQGVAEGLGKSIKRAAQGWGVGGAPDMVTPAGAVKAFKDMDGQRLANFVASRKDLPTPRKGSARAFADKVIDREMKQRGYGRVADKDDQGVAEDQLDEKWTKKYKDSINCSNPKGFSQKAHCAGKQKNESAIMKGLK